MVDFKDLVGKFIVSALMILGLFFFIVIIQEDNSAVNPLINEEIFNDSMAELILNIDNGTQAAEEKYGVFNSEEPKPGVGSILLFGIVSVGKQFSNIVFGTFGALIKLPLVVLGIPQTVYGSILTWLIITAIVTLWLLYKFG